MIPDSLPFDEYLRAEDDGRSKVHSAADFVNEVVNLIHGDEDTNGTATPWEKVGNRLTFRPGEVTLWAGINGHGKSGTLGFFILHAIAAGAKACIASMEMKPAATLGRMCRQSAAGNSPSIEFIDRFHRWTDGKLWLFAHQGQVKADRMISVARYCRKELGIDHIVIDSLMKCGMAPDDYAGQKNFVDALCALARDTGLHVHLVHHIRKGENESVAPNKFDVKGAGEITDLVDNVLIVYRNKRKEAQVEKASNALQADAVATMPDTILICDKQRHYTWEGKINLWFDGDSQQLIEHATAPLRYLDFESGEWNNVWRRK